LFDVIPPPGREFLVPQILLCGLRAP
jgi:hypothetical protein